MRPLKFRFDLAAEDAIEQELGKPILESLESMNADKSVLRVIAKHGLHSAGMGEKEAEDKIGKVSRDEILDALFRDLGINRAYNNFAGNELRK